MADDVMAKIGQDGFESVAWGQLDERFVAVVGLLLFWSGLGAGLLASFARLPWGRLWGGRCFFNLNK